MTPSMKPLVALTCAVMTAAAPIATPVLAQGYGSSQTVAAGSGPRLVNLPRGTSFAVDLPADARDVIVSNPTVAEANVHSPRRITVIGIAPGETDAVFLDAAGRAILTLRVRVDTGTSALQDTLSRVAPGSQVRAEAVNDSIILTGLVGSAAESERVASVARAFVSAPEKVVNLTTIAASDQVTLRVRIVEVQRNAIKQLGFSSDVVFNSGLQSVSFGRANTYGVNGSALGGSGACYNENRGRATDFQTSDITENETTSGSSSTGTTTNTTSNDSTNTITNTTTTDDVTTVTTSDSRTITFDGDTPGTITVTDASGNTSTLTGDTAAQYLNSTVSSRSLTTAISGVLGSSVATSISSVIGSTLTENAGNLLTRTVQNLAQSAYQTVRGTNASACLQAFERVGLVRTLAEPNLTSVNGESASFLAGGEYPVPTGRDRDGNITIEFKPYGVSLAFRPIVLSEGRISLQLNAEVSELTQTGGITLGAGTANALNIAGLNVRRVTNTVEMPSGGSMMIAGLLQESTRQTVDSYPGLGGLPVLGSLFRSRDYLSGETELVVIVEPFIVNPTSRDQMQTPADGLRIASDLQTVFLGQLNQAYGTPAPGSSAAAAWQGPIGYVIE